MDRTIAGLSLAGILAVAVLPAAWAVPIAQAAGTVIALGYAALAHRAGKGE